MKSLKNIRCVLLCVLFACVGLTFAFANTNEAIGVYLDDRKVEINANPKIINGYMLLPLRTTFKLFEVPVYWEPKTKTIKATIGDHAIELKINQKQAQIFNGQLNRDIFLDQAPVILSNNVYVPLRFIAEMFNCNVKYDQGTKRLTIKSPFIFKNNQWCVNDFENKSLVPIEKYKYLKYLKQNAVTYFVLHIGDLTMYHEYLYALDNKGNDRLLFSDHISDFKIEGDNCFFISNNGGLLNLGTLVKVNLSVPLNKVELGNPGFAYGAQVKIRKGKDDGRTYFSLVAPDYKWQIRPDGIYIIAYNTKMNLEDSVVDLPLLEKSHGYYLVDKNGRGQKLVKNIKVDE